MTTVSPSDDEAWIAVHVELDAAWGELAAEILGRAPASPAAVEPLGDRVRVTSWLPSAAEHPNWLTDRRAELRLALDAAGAPDEPAALQRTAVSPANWRGPQWRAFRVGRVCIVPPDAQPTLRADDVVIRLEPGAAFGTGRHATTRTCLRALQTLPLDGARVLDVGCGTGLLGLAAARLGAARATLLDDDPLATACARELVAAHDLDAACPQITGDLSRAREVAPVDVLIANLEGPLLRARADELAALLRPGGAFLVSGIKAEHEDLVIRDLGRAGLVSEARLGTPRWRTLRGHREDTPSDPGQARGSTR